MARTTRRRRRKRRGTQGGRIDTRARGRPRNRAEARARAKSRGRGSRGRDRAAATRSREPTWRGAATRGLIAAGVFLVLLILLFGRPVPQSVALAAFMLLIYIPMGYYIDRFFYRLRLRREAKERERRRAERAGG